MTEAPNDVQWAAIRGNVASLADAVKKLSAENAALKRVRGATGFVWEGRLAEDAALCVWEGR